ncbi:MAG: flagellar export chaperone FliS [Nitrospirota bacterium]
MINPAYALNAYKQTQVETTTNPMELIVMLYDGAMESLDKAAAAMMMKELPVKIKYIDKGLAIIEELLNSLNAEAGGEIALQLEDLYFYMIKEITLANISNDPEKIRHIIVLLKELREAWVHIRNTL